MFPITVAVRYSCVLFLCIATVVNAAPVETRLLSSVAVSRDSFNPALGEHVSISATVSMAGSLEALILDRDGYVVRRLGTTEIAGPGIVAVKWDGRSDSGAPVFDEAYSFKLDFDGASGKDSYFPAAQPAKFFSVNVDSYDRRGGTLRYTLPSAARVHIQAGSATADPATGTPRGPVLKTVVNRAPRPIGSVVETWRGLDESGTIYVPDVPNFVVAIAATTLPENSVITTGNRSGRFINSIGRRQGRSVLPSLPAAHHHVGLTAVEDVAPVLQSKPVGARWSATDKAWIAPDRKLRFGISLSGPNAEGFAKQPGRVVVFVGQQNVLDVPASPTLGEISVQLPAGTGTTHIVAVNWVTDHGPVAATSFRVRGNS